MKPSAKLLILFILSAPLIVLAQPGIRVAPDYPLMIRATISGHVTDLLTKQPIHASLTLRNLSLPMEEVVINDDSTSGTFKFGSAGFDVEIGGRYSLSVSAAKYEPWQLYFDIPDTARNGFSLEREVHLTPILFHNGWQNGIEMVIRKDCPVPPSVPPLKN